MTCYSYLPVGFFFEINLPQKNTKMDLFMRCPVCLSSKARTTERIEIDTTTATTTVFCHGWHG